MLANHPTLCQRNSMKRLLILCAALAAFTVNASTNLSPASVSAINAAVTPTNVFQWIGLPSGFQGVLGSIQGALNDAQPFIANDMLHLDVGGLYNRHATRGQYGGFIDALIPGAIAKQTSVGFGLAYLDNQWLEANVNLQLGTTMTLPVIGKLYAWVASGPDYNLKTRSIGAYNFAGALKAWKLPKLPLLGGNWNLLVSGGLGDFSTIPGTTYEGSLGLAKNF